MFQTQEKPIPFIKTSLSIEQVQDKEKNYQLKKFETGKLNNFSSFELDHKRQWTPEEENIMFELHNQHGNKWAIIAEKLNGRQLCCNKRSDNSLKNHFYSRLRKGLRKLNKIINSELKKTFKQFKIIDLYKVIEASDQKFKEIKTEQYEFANVGLGKFNFMKDLKNRIFLFAQQNYDSTEETKARVRKLINDLSTFTKDYKRKSKKNRRYSPMRTESVYRAHIKGTLYQTQSNQKPITSEQQMDVQNGQQADELMVELRKTSTRNGLKQIDLKNEVKKQVKQLKKGLKKGVQIVGSSRTRSKKSYKNFSEDEEEMGQEWEELREQRLDNFAQKLLKTFKSYISLESFNSNGQGEELFH